MKPYLPYLLAVVAFILGLSLCKGPEVHYDIKINQDSLKKEIANALRKRDTVLIEVRVKDEARTKIITRFKEVRHDSLIPCEEKLVICDTVIRVDSALINKLKCIVKLDSLIISNQNALIIQDSIQIVGLKKEVKKQKRHKRLLIGLGAVLAGFGITK